MVKFKGPLYDKLKFIAQILLPALGALYFGLAGIWGLPAAEQIVGTIVVLDTFLGVVLQLSSAQYSRKADGSIKVIETDESKTYSLELEGEPEDIDEKEEVVFKVVKP